MAHVEDRWEKVVADERVRTSRYGRGKRYRARWTTPDGKERSAPFAKKGDAERYVLTLEAAKLRNLYMDPAAGRVSLRDYAENRWLSSLVHVRPATLETYRAHLRNNVLPVLGDRELRSIRRADMRPFVADLTRRLKPSTVGTAFAVLRMVMQAAVDDEVIAANPCSRVQLPRIEPRVLEPLPPDAVRLLAERMTARYRVTVWLSAGAGLREGEALGLTVPRIDFLRRRLAVEEQMQTVAGRSPQLSPLKTRASRRVVPLDDVVLDAITAHLQGWPSDSLVVRNRLGEPVRRSSFGHCWRQAVEAAGLPAGTRFHDLRHFFASTLIAANLHPKVIQSRLGHATIAETMNTYGHLFPDAEDQGRGAVEAVLRPSQGCDLLEAGL